MVKVLFVCMGNICRSPTAHGVFVKILNDQSLTSVVQVDSAGTHAYHIGKGADERSQLAASRRGIDLSSLRARQVKPADFHEFDYVLAMDDDNLQHLEMICPIEQRKKLQLFMTFAPQMKKREVPDPYYGGSSGFEQVLDLVEAAAEGLLQDIKNNHL